MSLCFKEAHGSENLYRILEDGREAVITALENPTLVGGLNNPACITIYKDSQWWDVDLIFTVSTIKNACLVVASMDM